MFLRGVGNDVSVEIRLPEEGSFLVGRASDCDLVLVDSLVSQRHVRFEVHPARNSVMVTDEGSRNGTFLDGKRIVRARAWPGGRVLVGVTHLRVEQDAIPGPPFRGVMWIPPDINLGFALLLAAQARRSVTVRVESGLQLAVLSMSDGVLTDVHVDGVPAEDGAEALHAILSWPAPAICTRLSSDGSARFAVDVRTIVAASACLKRPSG